MSQSTPTISIGIFGDEPVQTGDRHGCGLWDAGIAASLTAAEATPVPIEDLKECTWEEVLSGLQGVVLTGHDFSKQFRAVDADSLCGWCKKNRFPILAIDHGMHMLNNANGGSIWTDLPREIPEAIQHRHPPEPGLRHAINIVEGTRLARLYGDGEVIVNSEHHRALNRVARGFTVGATALDGVVEAIESADPSWFAMGVQWQPATSTASGLDIQLFRGIVDACLTRPSLVEQPAA